MFTVRPATPDDAPDIVRINVRAWQVAYAGIVPDDILAAMDVDDRIERYRDRMRRPSQFENVVAVEAGRTVGYTAFGPYRIGRHEGILSRRIGEVIAIYVDPSRWGTGTGRALIDAALLRLAERGFTSVRLWVLAENTQARRFYERAGFVADGARAGHPIGRPDGSVVDLPVVRYARPLP